MTLLALTEDDLETVLAWRNTPAVRQGMYNHHEITLSEHRAWFQRVQNDPTSSWYLYRGDAGGPAGVVYFTSRDLQQRSAFWGFYTSPDAGPGTGIRMAVDALELGFGDLKLAKVCAEVLVTNNRSVAFHMKIGFSEEGTLREQHFNGVRRVDVVRLGMLAGEWPVHRQRLQARVAELDDARTGVSPPPLIRRNSYPE